MADLRNNAPGSANDEVTIVGSDHTLRNRIGAPLSALFTDNRIADAQRALDSGKLTLFKRCLKDVEGLKSESKRLSKDKTEARSDILYDMRRVALRIKSTAGMADYPMASIVSDLLYKFLGQVKANDEIAHHIVVTHANAINAIFSENIHTHNDPTTMRVIIELEELVEEYDFG